MRLILEVYDIFYIYNQMHLSQHQALPLPDQSLYPRSYPFSRKKVLFQREARIREIKNNGAILSWWRHQMETFSA